jgi:hypothetical protein
MKMAFGCMVLFLGIVGLYLALRLPSESEATRFFHRLNSYTGQLFIWILAVIGFAIIVLSVCEKQ